MSNSSVEPLFVCFTIQDKPVPLELEHKAMDFCGKISGETVSSRLCNKFSINDVI